MKLAHTDQPEPITSWELDITAISSSKSVSGMSYKTLNIYQFHRTL